MVAIIIVTGQHHRQYTSLVKTGKDGSAQISIDPPFTLGPCPNPRAQLGNLYTEGAIWSAKDPIHFTDSLNGIRVPPIDEEVFVNSDLRDHFPARSLATIDTRTMFLVFETPTQ